MGVCGCCRGDEIDRMKIQDIEKRGELLLVRVPDTKTGVSRAFTMSQEFVPYVNKYAALRPSHATAKNFFLNYQKSKCTIQVIGKNKIAKIPLKIASYLQLENPGEFTGHSLRRSSATVFANSGANMLELQRFGGWQSETVARGYIDDSNVNRQNNATKISKMVTLNNTTNSNGIDIEDNVDVNEPPRKKLATESNSLSANVLLDKHLNINFIISFRIIVVGNIITPFNLSFRNFLICRLKVCRSIFVYLVYVIRRIFEKMKTLRVV